MISILKSPSGAAVAGVFSWFSIQYFPSAMLGAWLLIAMLGDFITGLLRSWSNGKNTTSEGLRKSVTKITSYGGAVLVVIILVNVIAILGNVNGLDLSKIIDGLMGFLVFVELFSICENIEEAYPESPLTIYFIRPLMKLLKGKIKNLPIQD